MNIDFSNIANLTPIGFARFLFDSTKPDGTLHIPKNFGTEFESDDEFNIFKMSWGREELDQLILKFNALYAGLSEIAKVYDELDDNDEEHVRSVLNDSALFDIWQKYLRLPQMSDLDEGGLSNALDKDARHEELSESEMQLLNEYYSRIFEESKKRLGSNRFAYDVRCHASSLYACLYVGAPLRILIEHEARCLIGYMALYEYADCK